MEISPIKLKKSNHLKIINQKKKVKRDPDLDHLVQTLPLLIKKIKILVINKKINLIINHKKVGESRLVVIHLDPLGLDQGPEMIEIKSTKKTKRK